MDNVNSPAHYNRGGIETIDYLESTLGHQGFLDYCLGNVLKYVSRWRSKNGLEDLKKAQWYLNKTIDTMQKNQVEDPREKAHRAFQVKAQMEKQRWQDYYSLSGYSATMDKRNANAS